MIKIELELTPSQLLEIAQILNGGQMSLPGVSTEARVEELKEDINQDLVNDLPEATVTETTAAVEEPAPVPGSVFAASDAVNGISEETGTAVELDSKGLPWDVRIHGKAKNKNADGSWRYKQGIDRENFVPQVEAELRAAMGAPTPKPATGGTASSAAEPAPQPTSAPVVSAEAPTPVPVPPPAAEAPVPVPPPAAEAPVPVPPPVTPPAATASKPTTFAELLPLVTAAKASGALTDEKINEVSAALGLAQFGLIATRPDLIPQMAELLGV